MPIGIGFSSGVGRRGGRGADGRGALAAVV